MVARAKPVKAAVNASTTSKTKPQPTIIVRKSLSKTERDPAKPLTPAQERFVEEYRIDLNATRAYMAAHPHVKVTTASTEGVKYLGKPWVAEKIALLKKERTDRLQLDGDAVVWEILAVGTAGL